MIDRRLKVIAINEHEALASVSVRDLLETIIPARDFAANAKVNPLQRRMVERLRDYHDMIQRDFSGEKKRNAQGLLADYIRDEWLGSNGRCADGFFGPLIAYFPDKITIDEDGTAHLRSKGFLLDGESRAEALLTNIDRLEDDARLEKLFQKPVALHIVHGIEKPEVVAKYFADVNGKGVRVNPNRVAMADYTNPYVGIAKRIFRNLDLELEDRQRQVRPSSSAVLTGLQARMMVAAVAKGVGAVQYGGKPIPTEGVDFERLEDVAEAWLSRVFSTFGAKSFRDKLLILRAVPVSASLGGLGRSFFVGDSEGQRVALDVLTDKRIDWNVGAHWDGIAGRLNPNTGRFAVGGGKEYAYATYRALTEPASEIGQQIRPISPEVAS